MYLPTQHSETEIVLVRDKQEDSLAEIKANETPKKKKKKTKKSKSKRRVHFHPDDSEHDVVVEEVHHVDNVLNFAREVQDSMYTRRGGMATLKYEARMVAKQVQSSDRKLDYCGDTTTYSQTMLRAYKSCSSSSSSSNNNNNEETPTTTNMSPEEKLIFNLWVSSGESRRGLERWCIPSLDYEVRTHRSKSIETIVKLQSKTVDGVRLKDIPEVMAEIYSRLCEPSQRFARAMGEADAAAAGQGKTRKNKQATEEEEEEEKKEEKTRKTKEALRGSYVQSRGRVLVRNNSGRQGSRRGLRKQVSRRRMF